MSKYFGLTGPDEDNDDGSEHDDYGEESGPDSPPNDNG